MFATRNMQLTRVFARATTAWLPRGNLDDVADAAELLLNGSAQYVRISVNGVVILDLRGDEFSVETSDLAAPGGLAQEPGESSRLREDGVDVWIRFILPGRDPPDAGVVQVGFSDDQADLRVREYRRMVGLLAGGSWLALALALILAARLLGSRWRSVTSEDDSIGASGLLRCGLLEIDTNSCSVQWNGESVDLTPKTFELLTFLARNPGKTYSDADLLEALWADAPYAASNDVKQCIYLLRQRLGAIHPDPKRIVANVKGFGYRLEVQNERTLNDGSWTTDTDCGSTEGAKEAP